MSSCYGESSSHSDFVESWLWQYSWLRINRFRLGLSTKRGVRRSRRLHLLELYLQLIVTCHRHSRKELAEMERNMLCSVMREADNAKHDFPGLTEPNAWLTKPVRSPSCVHPC